jgi:hypothetical protein
VLDAAVTELRGQMMTAVDAGRPLLVSITRPSPESAGVKNIVTSESGTGTINLLSQFIRRLLGWDAKRAKPLQIRDKIVKVGVWVPRARWLGRMPRDYPWRRRV